MKSIVCLFAILALGSALPLSSENEEELLMPLASEIQITPEQKQCIEDSVTQIVSDNPQLDWWFAIVNKSTQRIIAKAEGCAELQNPDLQRKCFRAIRVLAKIEKVRLVLILPKDDRKIIGVLNSAVRDCFRDPEEIVVDNMFDDDLETY